MRIIYDIFFLLFAMMYLPYFLLKGKYHQDYLQRFGIFKKDTFSGIARSRPIWLHAVSVGEMKTAEGLIKKTRELFPSKRFVISNVTKTGHDIAVSAAGDRDIVIYFPMDLSFVSRRIVGLINPSLFVAIETEIWPNLITELHARGIPVVLMNGRISPNSFRNYLLIRPVISGILNKVALFCMSTEADAERIRRLGASRNNVKVTGNMKFDSVFAEDKKEEECWPPIKNKDAWLPESSRLIIAGSTHHGEDISLLESFKALKKDFPRLRLLIAPRHIERAAEIEALAGQAGLRTVRFSEVEKKCAGAETGSAFFWGGDPVFILDSIGRLGSLYRLAAMVFMGGSLVPHGGHNFIEPAVHAKPIITGPHVDNFKDMSELFKRNNAIEIAQNGSELTDSLRRLSSDEARCRTMGERAKKVVFDNMGSTDRNIALIKKYL